LTIDLTLHTKHTKRKVRPLPLQKQKRGNNNYIEKNTQDT
jgi:hypothetical protein